MAGDFMTLAQLLGTSNKSIFEDDVPDLRAGESRDFAVEGHHMRVTGTSALGCDTGRRRYRVECLTCGELLHEATTGAYANMERHIVRLRWAAEAVARAVAKDAK